MPIFAVCLICVTMKTMRNAILSILVLLAAASCSGRKDGAGAVRLGAMSSMDFVPYAVALEKGICDSVGLDLELVRFFSATERDAALQAGAVDGTITDLTGALMQYGAGTPLRIVCAGDGYFTLLASPGHGRDLHGAVLALSSHTAIDFVTDSLLGRRGLGEGGFSRSEIGKIPLRMEMLLASQVDAAVLPDPFASIAAASGAAVLGDSRELGLDLTCTVLSDSFIRASRDKALLLMECYDKAVEYMESHPRAQWQDVLVKYAGVPQEMAASINLPQYRPSRLPSGESIAAAASWLEGRGLVPSGFTADSITAQIR